MEVEIQRLAGEIAGVVSLSAFVPYIIKIYRGKTLPSISSWWIWTVMSLSIAWSYDAAGAESSKWVFWGDTFGTLVVALVSLKYKKGGFIKDSTDQGCVIAAAASFGVWWILDSPLTALLINIFIDFTGAIPTIKKAYRKPQEEYWLTWVLIATADFINLFAIENINLAVVILPVYAVIADTVIMILVCVQLKHAREKATVSI